MQQQHHRRSLCEFTGADERAAPMIDNFLRCTNHQSRECSAENRASIRKGRGLTRGGKKQTEELEETREKKRGRKVSYNITVTRLPRPVDERRPRLK